MKGNELARSKITDDTDPFKLINTQTNENSKSDDDKEDAEKGHKKKFMEEGSEIIRRSGFDEGMLRANFQLQDEKIFVDQSVEDRLDSKIKKAKSAEPSDNTDKVNINL